MSLRERLAAAVGPPRDAQEADPDTYNRDRSTAILHSRSRTKAAERIEPPKDELETYWRQYQSFPLIRASIDQYAEDVVEPGYWITAENDETRRYLEKWCSSAAVMAGDPTEDLSKLLRQIPLQIEVRGTVTIMISYEFI